MKKLQLFTMLTLLSTGYVMQGSMKPAVMPKPDISGAVEAAQEAAQKAVDKVEERASWSIRHDERLLDRDVRDQVMSHPGLRRYIERVEKFINDLKTEKEFTKTEHEYLMEAVSDIHSKFNSDLGRYSNLRSRVKALTEKAEAFLAAEQA